MTHSRSIQPCSRTLPALSGPVNAEFTLLIPLGMSGTGGTSVNGSLSPGSGLGSWGLWRDWGDFA